MSTPAPEARTPTDAFLAELAADVLAGDESFLPGDPVPRQLLPADLVQLWWMQEAGETELLDAFELVLIAGLDAADVLDPLAEDPSSDPIAIAALQSVCSEIRFVAEALDGLLLGYWFVPGVGECVVALDSGGQLELVARTFGDALVAFTDPDDADEAAEVVEALIALGVPTASSSVAEVASSLSGVRDPNQVVLDRLLDLRLAADPR